MPAVLLPLYVNKINGKTPKSVMRIVIKDSEVSLYVCSKLKSEIMISHIVSHYIRTIWNVAKVYFNFK